MEERTCRVCGCTEEDLNDDSGTWAEQDLCSDCVEINGSEIELELEGPKDSEAVEVGKQAEELEAVRFDTAIEKLEAEYKQFKTSFKNSGKEAMVSKPVLDALINFCEDSGFSTAVLANPNTLQNCLSAIMKGVGSSISDLEVYQRAVAFYFPNAKISFQMTIDTNGVEIPVAKKIVEAKPNNTFSAPQVKTETKQVTETREKKKIVINLDGLI